MRLMSKTMEVPAERQVMEGGRSLDALELGPSSPQVWGIWECCSCWRATWVFMVQVVHICDKAVVWQEKAHPSQQHGKVDPMVSILGLRILRNCCRRGKKEKKSESGTTAPVGPAAGPSLGEMNGGPISFVVNERVFTHKKQLSTLWSSQINDPSPEKHPPSMKESQGERPRRWGGDPELCRLVSFNGN